MTDKIIGIITEDDSDLLHVLRGNGLKLHVMKPDALSEAELDRCYSLAILAGTGSDPLLFNPTERIIIEKQIRQGKKVFSEFCNSIGNVYSQDPTSTRFERVCFCDPSVSLDGVELGDLLDEQCNTRIKPWDMTCSTRTPLLQYVRVNAHSHTEVDEQTLAKADERAVWFDDPENLLICAFRISNYIKARFAPVGKWQSVIRFILEWLCDEQIDVEIAAPAYHFRAYDANGSLTKQVRDSVDLGIDWFENADLLLADGTRGLKEGVATEIFPDGTQRTFAVIRPDCMGEVSFAYFMHYLLDGDRRSFTLSQNLSDFIFNSMQAKDEGPFQGMLRWSNQAWGVCYQDDVARAVIYELLKCLYKNTEAHLNESVAALAALAKTTGTDGTRVMRTDAKDLSPEAITKLATEPANYPSAHYNAYYLAALLLAHKLTGNAEFRAIGVKGMETIMSFYPNTIREHSETQELCRLVLPLAYLFWVTREERHKQWLYQATEDLQRFRHSSGAYLEWDTGYQSARFGQSGDECSLLTKNGDPVADLLYSLNWLPMAFAQAYLVTGDRYFQVLWEDTAQFMVSVQIHSSNKQINGGWARALDVSLMEVFALPNDLGWGPWAIESGWTVGEILSGLACGLLCDDLKKFY